METLVQVSRHFVHRTLVLLALLAGLTAASPAAAQQSVQDGYGGQSQVLGEVGSTDSAPSSSAAPTAAQSQPGAPVTRAQEVKNGNLPFTGLDIALLGVGGGLLLGLGLVVRRVTRDPVAARQTVA